MEQNDPKRVYTRLMDALVIAATEMENAEVEFSKRKHQFNTLQESANVAYEAYKKTLPRVTTPGAAPVNHHGKQKEALDVALNAIRNAKNEFQAGYPNDAQGTLTHALSIIENILES